MTCVNLSKIYFLRFIFHYRQLFVRLAEELEKRDMPDTHDNHEKKGAEPILIGRVDYDDETLPLKDIKKVS